MDQFTSHLVRELFSLLCPELFQSDAPHKSQGFVRSRKSIAWKAKQGPLKSIFGDELDQGQNQTKKEVRQPPEFHEVTWKYVTMPRTSGTLNENEIRSLAASSVACLGVASMLLSCSWKSVHYMFDKWH